MSETGFRSPMLTRRHILAAGAAGLVGAVVPAAHAADAAPAGAPVAHGRVTEEGSGKGIPGVMVSNGRDVVKTDADGRWDIAVADGQSVFVIKPAGWMTPVDPDTMLPRFAYVHAPNGSPADLGFRFAGLAPTGPLPESIDFTLRRQDEKPRFNAILFTDPQPESLAEVGFIRDDVVAQTAGVEAAFGITHGDIMFDDLSFYDRQNRIVGTVGLPWYNLPGNHDMNLEAPDNTHSRETFKRVFGARYAAFQYGGATFLTLDNVDYLGTDPAKPLGFGKYRGFFGERQLAFVRNVLANVPTDSLVVVSFHIPLRTVMGTDPAVANVDTKEFLAAIATHPNTVSFAGHTHTNEHWYLGAADGNPGPGEHHHHVLGAVSGSWWSGPFDERGIPVALASDGSPNGFHLLEIDGARYTTRLIGARAPECAPMRIVLDSQAHGGNPELLHEYPVGALLRGPIARAAAGSTRVVVNLFDGGPRSKVELKVGRAGDFAPMRRTARTDPFVEEVYARNAAVKKPWVQPVKSPHIWEATLPADLPAGSHRLTVRATDEYGREAKGWMVLEVTA